MTGLAVCEVLADLDAEVIVTDTRVDLSALRGAIDGAEAAGAVFMNREAASKLRPQVVVVSPGVAASHPLLEAFRRADAEVISEIELAFRLAEGVMVAITGTNGKTTATGLAGSVLSAKYADVRVTGNIGAPLIKQVKDSSPETVFVTEISSYQLETCGTLRPHIGVVLNVQPDHLERHKTMQAYAEVKRRLIENQQAEDFALLNAGDPLVAAMSAHTRARVLSMSVSGSNRPGCFINDTKLIVNLTGEDEEIADTSRMLLPGEHNALNALAAGAAGLIMGVPADAVRERIHTFKGFSHRIEKIAELNGVTYINDSKSTNIDSTLAALKTFSNSPVILIIGGDDKGLDYATLYSAMKLSVKSAIVLGHGLLRMLGELRAAGFEAVSAADTMEQAVRFAAGMAAPGAVVLLSPASSSFDIFKNFEDRGEQFNHAVKSL